MNNKSDKDTPRFDVQLLFDEIGVLLDDNQYRDAISLLDMYHFYIRQHQVRTAKIRVRVGICFDVFVLGLVYSITSTAPHK